MIRMKKSKCGWKDFKCTGLPKLHKFFTKEESVFDRLSYPEYCYRESLTECMKDASGEDIPRNDPIFSWYNIPMSVTLFVPSVPTIYQLDHLASAVSGCEVNHKSPLRAYIRMDTVEAWAEYDGNEPDKSDLAYSELKEDIEDVNFLPMSILQHSPGSFKLPHTRLCPGMLDVMINPMPPPIAIRGMPDFDMALDGIFFAIYNMVKWQNLTNERLEALEKRKYKSTSLKGIKNMLIAANTETTCENFKITYESGPILTQKSGNPRYAVSSGVVFINGQSVQVKGDSFTAPFDVCVSLSKDEAGTWTGELVEASSVALGAYIGSVKKVDGGDNMPKKSGYQKTSEDYNFFQIIQGPCVVSVDYFHLMGDGFAFAATAASGGKDLKAIPYKVCQDKPTQPT